MTYPDRAAKTIALGLLATAMAVGFVWLFERQRAGSPRGADEAEQRPAIHGDRPSDRLPSLGERSPIESPSGFIEELESVPASVDCLESVDEWSASECARQLAENLEVDELASVFARWICSGSRTRGFHESAVTEVLRVLRGGDVFEFMDRMQQRCDMYRSRQFLTGCLRALGETDPDCRDQIALSLTPESAFSDARGIAVVQALEELAKHPGAGEWARHILEEGGLGSFGGTVDQLDRAVLISIAIQEGPRERLEYMQRVVDSPSVPGDATIGYSLVAQLYARGGGGWPGGNAAEAMSFTRALLGDPRFALDAATQLLHGVKEDAKPTGVLTEDWLALRELARTTLSLHGR